MNAREKLNKAALTGAVVFGGLAGLATGSLLIGVVVIVIVIGLACTEGSIRSEPQVTTQHGRHSRRHR